MGGVGNERNSYCIADYGQMAITLSISTIIHHLPSRPE